MFKNLGTLENILKNISYAMLFLLSTTANASALELCESAISIDPNSSVETWGEAGETQIFEVMIDEPGYLFVEAIAAAEPVKIGLLGQGCTIDRSPGSFAHVNRRLSAEVLRIDEPGVFSFRVAAQARHASLGSYQVHTAFVHELSEAALLILSGSAVELCGDLSGGDENNPDPDLSRRAPGKVRSKMGDENNPDPDLLTVAMRDLCADLSGGDENNPDPDLLTVAAGGVDLSGGDENNPDPDLLTVAVGGVDLSGGDENNPDPDLLAGPTALANLLGCALDGDDDHGNTFHCASTLRLGEVRSGEIRYAASADADTLTFVLTAPRTVTLEVHSDVTIQGALFDHQGHRLELGSLEDGQLELSSHLNAGQYFLRLTGEAGAEGSYEVFSHSAGW